jgi:general secretion pathway protein L
MTTLIVTLPLALPSATTEYDYLLTPDGLTLAGHGRATAALLPATAKLAGDVVAVVPARALSWHRLELPRGTLARSAGNPQRLRAVLSGLLEEQLLDEPEQLHFALAPDARADEPLWVAVCDRAWLRASLQALEAAQRPVSRIVPEFSPDMAGQAPAPALYVTDGLEPAQLVSPGAHGVTVLPLSAASVSLLAWPAEDELVAEPGVAALAEQLFKRRVSLQQSPQRWLQAAQSPWNLAQFDLASSGHARTLKRLASGWHAFLGAPQWRAARWSSVLLVAIHLLGLNAWAWKDKTVLDEQRAAIRATLTSAFPGVTVVVDAPVQMARAVADLRQATGAASGHDLEAILVNLSAVLPASRSLSAMEFAAGEARLKGLNLSAAEASSLAARLQARGYTSRVEADTLVIRQEDGR